VFIHVACFRWNEGTGPDDIAAVASALGELPASIPELRDYRFGPDARLAQGNHDFAVVATFDDRDGYLAYADHPAHLRVLTEVIRPRLAARAAVQFET
jgi:Stress responsive A/B Barrel Domain